MLTSRKLLTHAKRIQTAQKTARQIEPFTSLINDFDIPSAYAVADLVHQARVQHGAVSVGRKIGFTNPRMWELYGVYEPIWAHVYDRTLVQKSGDLSTYSLAGFTEPKIEPEIVFHFHRAPATGGGDLSSLLECIDWVAQGFEIVQSHFSGWKFCAADAVADSGLHGALLVGEPQPVAGLGQDPIATLEQFSLSLVCDGKFREAGCGSNVLGNPLRAVEHLVAVLARQPEYAPLKAGELVTTGTITTAHTVHAGETWQTEIHCMALPNLSLKLTR